MKIVVALTSAGEVEPLIEAGADELYCGLVPAAFANADGESHLNRRYVRGANLADLADLEVAATLAREKNVPVAVALNEHVYDPARLPALVDFARGVAAAGAQALIVADLALILAIRRAAVPIDLHVSSVATILNAEAARFYVDLGVQRVILPRYLSTPSVASLCAAGLPVDVEAFAINDGCGFEEGLCMNLHKPCGPMCQMEWATTPVVEPGAPPDLLADWDANWRAYRRHMLVLDNRGSLVTTRGVPQGPCGLCALHALDAAGVGYVKVAGRDGPFELRSGGAKLVRAVLDWIEQGIAPAEIATRSKALRDMPAVCASTYACYYRDETCPVADDLAPTIADEVDRLLAATRATARTREARDERSTAAPNDPEVAAIEPAPVPDHPELARLLFQKDVLAGLEARWIRGRVELTMPDDEQPNGVSCVVVAPVAAGASYFARSGEVGVWYLGASLTARIRSTIVRVTQALDRAREGSASG